MAATQRRRGIGEHDSHQERLDVCRLALDFLVFAHQMIETLPTKLPNALIVHGHGYRHGHAYDPDQKKIHASLRGSLRLEYGKP